LRGANVGAPGDRVMSAVLLGELIGFGIVLLFMLAVWVWGS
jgi:hypothetical protein